MKRQPSVEEVEKAEHDAYVRQASERAEIDNAIHYIEGQLAAGAKPDKYAVAKLVVWLAKRQRARDED